MSGDITAQRYARDDARVLVQILDFLSCGGAPVIVFGGWAEELLGLAPRGGTGISTFFFRLHPSQWLTGSSPRQWRRLARSA